MMPKAGKACSVVDLSPLALTIDANVLVSELAGHEHMLHSILIDQRIGRLLIPEKTWGEAEHEVPKRFDAMVRQGRYGQEQADHLHFVAMMSIAFRISVIGESLYAAYEAEARRRMPIDPDDWHTIALALATSTAIWTQDKKHFFGCGLPVWSTPVLRAFLANRSEEDTQRPTLSPDALTPSVSLTLAPIDPVGNG
jgi:predicted nucleic acid-binding protein